MRFKTRRIFSLLGAFFFFFFMLVLLVQYSINDIPLFRDATGLNNFLLVDTEGCKIPKLDPYDSSIYWYLIGRGSELRCGVDKDLLYAKNDKIIINWSVVHSSGVHIKNCKYDVIWRPPDKRTHHDYHKFINESKPFTDNITVTGEFVRVRCFDNHNSLTYTNAFAFVHKKPSVEKRCNDNFQKHSNNKHHFNIMMVGVDSISRNNMIRYMPKTRDYLLKNMDSIEFLGYNKVADNTFLNIVPMTTGKFVEELPWNASAVDVPFDKYDFIWNKFSRKGYRTLYSEDHSFGQIFDYQKAGFAKPAADYFDRPYFVAMDNMTDIWNTDHQCVHARPETDIVLDYSKQFIRTFKTSHYFSFTFVTRLTHETISDAKRADRLYHRFLQDINDGATLNNTILIFFSDHGVRFGKVRQTFIGKLEERLPFLFFVLPPWFKSTYREFYRNMDTNRKRLVTPFDIYETLNHLMDFYTYSPKEGRGISVLHEVSGQRTCEQAAILPHWCTCSQQKILPSNDKNVINIADKFVSKLNDKLDNFKQCETLHVKRVISASVIEPSDVILRYKESIHNKNKTLLKFGSKVNTYVDYQITLETFPGNGMFEGTIRYDKYWNSINMMGDFSRINLYGTTSHCVQGIELKKMCYCKKQLK